MRHFFLLTCASLLGTAGIAAEPQPDVLRVTVSGLRNETGHVGCALFNRERGFPFEDARAMRLQNVKIKGGHAQCEFNGLPAGPYAIAVMHDENDNDKIDTNFFGVPTEGFGFSNNAKAHTFSPASFEEARFTYASGAVTMPIAVSYR